jgi:hypothetical protein
VRLAILRKRHKTDQSQGEKTNLISPVGVTNPAAILLPPMSTPTMNPVWVEDDAVSIASARPVASLEQASTL